MPGLHNSSSTACGFQMWSPLGGQAKIRLWLTQQFQARKKTDSIILIAAQNAYHQTTERRTAYIHRSTFVRVLPARRRASRASSAKGCHARAARARDHTTYARA